MCWRQTTPGRQPRCVFPGVRVYTRLTGSSLPGRTPPGWGFGTHLTPRSLKPVSRWDPCRRSGWAGAVLETLFSVSGCCTLPSGVSVARASPRLATTTGKGVGFGDGVGPSQLLARGTGHFPGLGDSMSFAVTDRTVHVDLPGLMIPPLVYLVLDRMTQIWDSPDRRTQKPCSLASSVPSVCTTSGKSLPP